MTEETPVRGGSVDRNLLSVATVSSLISMLFVITIIDTSEQLIHGVTLNVTCLGMIALYLLGIIYLILIFITTYKSDGNWVLLNRFQDEQSSKIRLMCLWLFGAAGILKASFDIAINIYCVNAKKNYAYFYITYCVLQLCYIVFICLEVSFITYFRKVVFKCSRIVTYGLMFILLTNVMMWLISLLTDSTDASISRDMHSNDTQNGTSNCYINSKILHFSLMLEPVLFPMRIQYDLLAVFFILTFWSSIRRKGTVISTNPGEIYRDSVTESDNSILVRSLTEEHNPGSTILAASVGLIINVSMLACVILHQFVLPGSDTVALINGVLLTSQKTSWLIMVYICFNIYSVYGKQKSEYQRLKLSEYIMIFVTAGSFAIIVPGVFYGLQFFSLTGIFTVAHGVVDLLANFNQTILLLLTSRQTISSSYKGFCSIHHIYLSLSIGNVLCWLLDSGHWKRAFLVDIYLGDEMLWVRKVILLPLRIFYRFHISIEFYNQYFLHRKK